MFAAAACAAVVAQAELARGVAHQARRAERAAKKAVALAVAAAAPTAPAEGSFSATQRGGAPGLADTWAAGTVDGGAGALGATEAQAAAAGAGGDDGGNGDGNDGTGNGLAPPPAFEGPGADRGRAAWAAAASAARALAAEQADDAAWAEDEDGAEGGGALAPERWLRLREVLATVALAQGRYGVVWSQCLAGQAEARARGEVRVGRRLRLLQGQAQARQGDLAGAEAACAAVLTAMAGDHLGGGALDFARACALAAGLRRDRALGAASARTAAGLLAEAAALLEAGGGALAQRARASGFMGVGPLTFMDPGGPGAGCGLGPDGSHGSGDGNDGGGNGNGGHGNGGGNGGSGESGPGAAAGGAAGVGPGGPPIHDNVMGADMTPPLLAALLAAAHNAEAAEASGTGAGTGAGALPLPPAARVCADVSDTVAPTPLANVYVPEVAWLASLLAARAALALDLPFERPGQEGCGLGFGGGVEALEQARRVAEEAQVGVTGHEVKRREGGGDNK